MCVGGDVVFFEGDLDMGVNVCAGLGCAYLEWFRHCGGFGVTFEVGSGFFFFFLVRGIWIWVWV